MRLAETPAADPTKWAWLRFLFRRRRDTRPFPATVLLSLNDDELAASGTSQPHGTAIFDTHLHGRARTQYAWVPHSNAEYYEVETAGFST
jgi:hypothetical protein